MKKIFLIYFVLLFSVLAFAKDKQVVYNKDTKEIMAVKISEQPAKDADRVNIACEGGIVIYGAKKDKVLYMAIDEKAIPADIISGEKTYKIDTDKKEIFEEITLEE